jgi:ribonuclease HI
MSSLGVGKKRGSVKFLVNYNATLTGLSLKENKGADVKGKSPLEVQVGKMMSHSRRVKEVWKPPRIRWVKLNTDAGFCRESGSASVDIVIRDHTSTVLLVAWKTLRRCGSPEEAEVEACLQGISLAEEWVKQPTIIESDCQLLIRAVESRKTDRSMWNDLVTSITAGAQLLTLLFQACEKGKQ